MGTWIDDAGERAEAATPGPWDFDGREVEGWDRLGSLDDIHVASVEGYACQPDGAFIASARTDVPRLCKALNMLLENATCDCGASDDWPDEAHSAECMHLVAKRIRTGDF